MHFKGIQVLSFEGLNCRQGNCPWVAVCTIQNKLIMQVWGLCQSGSTDIANNLTLSDSLPLLYRSFCEMQLLGDNAVSVLNKYMMPIVLTEC